MKNYKSYLSLLLLQFLIIACSDSTNSPSPTNPVDPENNVYALTIFHFNDQHGQIDNFSKIKHIVDQEKQETNVLVVCSGDIFSGNPVVDNHEEKGFPMIDLMNKIGVDVAVIGNHEFDYGEEILKDRLTQSEFDWICANVEMNNTGIPEPKEFTTVAVGELDITFLGLVETNGKDDDIIPSTHPWRVQNLTFARYESVVDDYAAVKDSEDSDLYIALTHLGENSDRSLAINYPYFDVIIGGHSHTTTNTIVNGIPIYQAGSNLRYLGKLELKIEDEQIVDRSYELINLANYNEYDSTIKSLADTYNVDANLDQIIGFAADHHSRSEVGNFYTHALLNEMNVDITFQNGGGVRSDLDEGNILTREIYEIDPFNNGSVIYTMQVKDLERFLKESGSGFYFSGLRIVQDGSNIDFINDRGEVLSSSTEITIGLNDYIPAVHDWFFTDTPQFLEFTTAETIINYLNNNSEPIDFTGYSNYFRYN